MCVQVGGVWRANYADFGLQVPKELYEFPEFPYPEGVLAICLFCWLSHTGSLSLALCLSLALYLFLATVVMVRTWHHYQAVREQCERNWYTHGERHCEMHCNMNYYGPVRGSARDAM